MTRTVVLAGPRGGIGNALCRMLLDDGHRVFGLCRSPEGVAHRRYTGISVNFSDRNWGSDLVDLKQQPIDTVVWAAGYGLFGHLEQLSPKAIEASFSVNVISAIQLIRMFLPLVKRHAPGDVVVIGSEAALRGATKGTIYCAERFALRGFTQGLRQECGKSRVRVGLINPGMVRTDFFSDQDFRPGQEPCEAIEPEDVAAALRCMLTARQGTIIDEINLTPQNRVVRFDL